MKKAVIFLSALLLLGVLASCSKDDVSVKKNWIFTIKVTTTYTPDTAGFGTQTVTTTNEVDGITEDEAKAQAKEMETEGTVTSTMAGITIKMVTTVTIAEKK